MIKPRILMFFHNVVHAVIASVEYVIIIQHRSCPFYRTLFVQNDVIINKKYACKQKMKFSIVFTEKPCVNHYISKQYFDAIFIDIQRFLI